jgi:hypothetical protein
MWKIALGFLIFAALGMFVIFKGGDKLDMAGEAGASHEVSQEAAPSGPVPATPASPAASVAGPAAAPLPASAP